MTVSTNRDEQARQRLVEIALRVVEQPSCEACRGQGYVERLHDGMIADYACEECWGLKIDPLCLPNIVRSRAGFRDPSKGSWCAAGVTAVMEDAGLLVPAPGTPARRGAIALLDWVIAHGDGERGRFSTSYAQPGDIIAWKQDPEPEEWLYVYGLQHAFATRGSQRSMCGEADRPTARHTETGTRCSDCVWATRKGHVALIVKVDEESVTTVGWNEGVSPGRVMMRRLWRDTDRPCAMCAGSGRHHVKTSYGDHVAWTECRKTEPRASTVLWRRPGGLYGMARPVAA